MSSPDIVRHLRVRRIWRRYRDKGRLRERGQFEINEITHDRNVGDVEPEPISFREAGVDTGE